MWGKIIIPMYRLWLNGLYELYGPRCPLFSKRPINLISLSLSLLRSWVYTIEDKGLDATASPSLGVGGLHTSGTPQTGVYQQPMFSNPVGSFGQCIMPTYHMDSGMEFFVPVMVPGSAAGSASPSVVNPTMMQMMVTMRMWDRMSTLNRHMVVPHFKMETQGSVRSAIRSQEWTISIDIRDAYLHVPMHQAVRKYLRFVVNKKVYQFTCLPFGLATSTREFTKLLRPVVSLLRQH